MAHNHDPLLVRIPEVARRLGIARGLAYQMARDGRLPTVVLGKRAVRVPLARLEDWIEERTREADARPNEAVVEVKPTTAGEAGNSDAARSRSG
jgi:excisionase family DNA binding protein